MNYVDKDYEEQQKENIRGALAAIVLSDIAVIVYAVLFLLMTLRQFQPSLSYISLFTGNGSAITS